jgi:hypothetical protein
MVAQGKSAVTDMSGMIHIHGPFDGKFVAQFVTTDGRSLAIHVPEESAGVLRDLQELIPYGLVVPDFDATAIAEPAASTPEASS